MKKFGAYLLAPLLALALLLPIGARAQVPSSQPPYNTDIGALITNSLRTAGTVVSATQSNADKTGVVCRFVYTVSSGSPSTTFSIQVFDAASATWLTYATSTAATGYPANAPNTPYDVMVKAGAQITGLPTNMVAISLPLGRTWRVSQTIGSGSGAASPAASGTIGCNYLK